MKKSRLFTTFIFLFTILVFAVTMFIFSRKKQQLDYELVSETKNTYAVGINSQFNKPVGWEVTGTGSNTDTFEQGINSGIGSIAPSEQYENGITARTITWRVSQENNIQNYAQWREVSIIGGKKVYIDRYPYFLNRVYDKENKMELIDIVWEEKGITEYYFMARCNGDYDYRDILEEACFEMVKTWKVVE